MPPQYSSAMRQPLCFNRVTGVTMYPMDYYWLTKDVKLAA